MIITTLRTKELDGLRHKSSSCHAVVEHVRDNGTGLADYLQVAGKQNRSVGRFQVEVEKHISTCIHGKRAVDKQALPPLANETVILNQDWFEISSDLRAIRTILDQKQAVDFHLLPS